MSTICRGNHVAPRAIFENNHVKGDIFNNRHLNPYGREPSIKRKLHVNRHWRRVDIPFMKPPHYFYRNKSHYFYRNKSQGDLRGLPFSQKGSSKCVALFGIIQTSWQLYLALKWLFLFILFIVYTLILHDVHIVNFLSREHVKLWTMKPVKVRLS